MNVAVTYVYPVIRARPYFSLAARFAESYRRFPPEQDHQLYILCNGAVSNKNQMRMFNTVNHVPVNYDNFGWDIGAFQKFADTSRADLMVCLGAHSHFHRAGWLHQMAEAFIQNGPGLYGSAAYLAPNWHVRTTCFWFPPELLRSYPSYVGTSRGSRYEFEHGNTSFTRHVLGLGFPCFMVTWQGCFPFDQWHDHGPDFNQILVRDQHIHEPHSVMDGPWFTR